MTDLVTVPIDLPADELDAAVLVGVLADLDGHDPFVGADPTGSSPGVIACSSDCPAELIAEVARRHGLTPGAASAVDSLGYDTAICPDEESVRTLEATARGEVPAHITPTPEPGPLPTTGGDA